MIGKKTRQNLLTAQKNEITEHFIYNKLSDSVKDSHNKKVLANISKDELNHYNFWKSFTNEDVKPNKLKIWKYYLISRLLGTTFGIKLMEKGEESAQIAYGKLNLPGVKKVIKDEDTHENELINMINEEKLKYVGSMVLGLNDALVELTGVLAGLTLALQNTRLIAMAGLITGVAASMSMAASEYLSTKSETNGKDPLRASLYTGSAYVLTVLFLIFPFLLLPDIYLALGFTVLNAIIVIFIFTFYISVVKDLSFKKRFLEMTVISLGIATLTFIIGFMIRIFLGISV